MNLALQGKAAIVTGGSKGIGKGIAAALIGEGCYVCICARHADELEQAADELEAAGAGSARVLPVTADLTDENDRQKLVSEALQAFGKVDILVNNAATVSGSGTLEGASLEEWRELFDLNLFAIVALVKAVIPHMQEQEWGRIINVSSENGQQPYPDMMPYSASKGALDNFSKALSKQYADDGILVNAISPAFIETPLVDKMMEQMAEEKGITKDEVIQQFLENDRPHIAVKRPGQVDEVGPLVAFLASDKASFINGANYRVDGGSVASV